MSNHQKAPLFAPLGKSDYRYVDLGDFFTGTQPGRRPMSLYLFGCIRSPLLTLLPPTSKPLFSPSPDPHRRFLRRRSRLLGAPQRGCGRRRGRQDPGPRRWQQGTVARGRRQLRPRHLRGRLYPAGAPGSRGRLVVILFFTRGGGAARGRWHGPRQAGRHHDSSIHADAVHHAHHTEDRRSQDGRAGRGRCDQSQL